MLYKFVVLSITGIGVLASLTGQSPSKAKVPNYATDVAPILYARCTSCHSETRVGPFSLVGYQNARKFARMISVVTSKKRMPPWKANLHYGEFKDVPVLTDTEIDLLKRWADGGALEDDPSKEPAAPVLTPDWRLGPPDLVLTPDRPTKIPAEGTDFYRDYLVDPHITKPTWVRSVDFRPSGKNTVHHVIPMVLKKDAAEQCRKIKFDHDDDSWEQKSLDAVDFGDKTLGFWSTGAPPFSAPEDTGFLISPGDCIILDIHYKSTGKVELEHTQVGLYFEDKAPKKEVSVTAVGAAGIYLQPGDPASRVYGIQPVSKETTVYAVWPHMHYLGRTFKAWVKYPAGYSKPLVCINDWDPDWQLLYYYKNPMVIPPKSKIYVTGTFDNSANNPRNPNVPPRVVESGPSSKDEMLILYLYETVKADPAAKKKK